MTAARSTKTPGIPDIRDDNILEVLRAIKSTMEVREGRSGDDVDAHVTFRQLTDLGLTEEGKTTTGNGDIPSGGPPGSGDGLGPGGYDPDSDMSTPPAPVGLHVNGAFTAMYLGWDGAPYHNHAYTEIWRNTVDDLGTAILVGSTISDLYADVVDYDSTFYYWIRYVSRANVVGPYNSTAGTMGHTALDVGKAIEALSAGIVGSPLMSSLNQRINQIEVDNYIAGKNANAVVEQLKAADLMASSRLLELWNVTQSQATSLKLLESRGPGNGNTIYFTDGRPDDVLVGSVAGVPLKEDDIWYDTADDYRSYRWNGTDWLEFTLPGVKVYHRPDDPVVSNNGTDWFDDTGRVMREGDIWYDSDTVPPNHPYLWNNTGHVWADIAGGDNSAAIITLEQTKIGYATLDVNSYLGPAGSVFDNGGVVWNNVASGPDYPNSVKKWNETHTNIPGTGVGTDSKLTWHIGLPFAQSVKQVGVTYNGLNTTLQQQLISMETTDGKLVSQYTVKIDSNGYVAGYGLSTTSAGGLPPAPAPVVTSAFIVNADQFAIGPAKPANPYNASTPYTKDQTVYMTQTSGVPPVTVTHVFQSRQGGPGPPPVTNVGHTPIWGATKSETDPWWVDLSARLPFMATTIAQTIDGKTYQPGVWMNTANIADATIQSAQIENLVAQKIFSGTLEASISVRAGMIYGGTIDPTKTFAGPNWGKGYFLGNQGGVHKFYIGDTDIAYALWDGAAFRVRGTIYGTAGKIGGTNMDMDAANVGRLYSNGITGFDTGGIGFFLASDGTMRLGGTSTTGSKARMTWDGTAIRIYNAAGAAIFGAGGVDWTMVSGTIPAAADNKNVSITSGGALTNGAGTGGTVTAGGLDAAMPSGGILNQKITITGNNDGTITLTGAGIPAAGTAPGPLPGIGAFRITSTNVENFLGKTCITQAVIGLLQVGAAQMANAEITNAKIANLDVDTLWIHGNAVQIAQASQWPGDETVRDVEKGLFGNSQAIVNWTLKALSPVTLITFHCELQQGSNNAGAQIELKCYLRNLAGDWGIKTYIIGIINNQPRFSQTAVFYFQDVPAGGYWPRITAKQIGGTITDNIIGKSTIVVEAMMR